MHQTARLELRFGSRGSVSGSISVTVGGLLAVAVLVSSILLSTAILVRVSVREAGRAGKT
nr:hypothetical protein [uncultured Sphingomonas sp.]